MNQEVRLKAWATLGATLGKMMESGELPVLLIGIVNVSEEKTTTATYNVAGMPDDAMSDVLRAVADQVEKLRQIRDAAPNN